MTRINCGNGCNFSGATITDGVVVENGKVIKGTSWNRKDIKEQEFDERKTVLCEGVDKIILDSNIADMNVMISELSKDVETHFFGKVKTDGKVEFSVKKLKNEIRITVKSKGNIYDTDLNLEVSLPKKNLEVLSFISDTGDISLEGEFNSTEMELESDTGKIEVNGAMFSQNVDVKNDTGDVTMTGKFSVENTEIETDTGNVSLKLEAQKNICVDISTDTGDVSVELENIGCMKIKTRTDSGSVKKSYIERGEYTAIGNIVTDTGKIRIR